MAMLVQLLDDVVVHKFALEKAETRIGRQSENDIIIDDSAISGSHARLILQPNLYFAEYLEAYIEDAESTNGTFLNEQKVLGRQRLHHNDILRFAWNRFKFIDDKEQEMARTVHLLRTQSGST